MPIPNLIHPVPIALEQIDRQGTRMDPDTREPIQHAQRRDVITINGQPNNSIRTLAFRSGRGGGRNESEDGYILFRLIDLKAKGVVDENGANLPQVNDKVRSIGGINTDLYVERLEFMGNYSDTGGPTLVKVFLRDRAPAKKRGA